MTRRADEEFDVVVVGSGAGALVGVLQRRSPGSADARDREDRPLRRDHCILGGRDLAARQRGDPPRRCRRRLGRARPHGTCAPPSASGRRPPCRTRSSRRARAWSPSWRRIPRSSSSGDRFPTTSSTAPGGFEAGRSIYALPLPIAEVGAARPSCDSPLPADRGGSPQPEGMLIGGRALLGRLLMALDRRGVECRRNTALTALVVDDGRVVGRRGGRPVGPDGAPGGHAGGAARRRRVRAQRGDASSLPAGRRPMSRWEARAERVTRSGAE